MTEKKFMFFKTNQEQKNGHKITTDIILLALTVKRMCAEMNSRPVPSRNL